MLAVQSSRPIQGVALLKVLVRKMVHMTLATSLQWKRSMNEQTERHRCYKYVKKQFDS